MGWTEKWLWVLDAIVAVPGLRHGDIRWLADRYELQVWNTQLTRALQAATQDRLLYGDGRTGYHPTLLGVATLDAYRHAERWKGQGEEPSFEAAGPTIAQTLQSSWEQFGSGLTPRVVQAINPNQDPASTFTAIGNNPGLVLRGVLKARTVQISDILSRPRLSDIIHNSYTSKRPPGLWSEYWFSDPGAGGRPVPIITVDQERTALRVAIRLSEGFSGQVPALIIRRVDAEVPTEAEEVFASMGCEVVIVGD